MSFLCRTDKSIDAGQWLTEKQIMASNGYTDPEKPEYQTAKSALLLDLAFRDHEKPAMAAMNIKQYFVVSTRTEKSTGSSKTDSLLGGNEVDEKTAARIAKSFDSGGFAVQDGEVPEPKVQLEAWKKDALELERKVSQVQTRAGKALQVAKSMGLKLGRLASTGNSLAEAQKDNLEQKSKLLEKALSDFQSVLATVDTRTEQKSSQYADVAVPATATLKDHCCNFEKVSRMAGAYINMCE